MAPVDEKAAMRTARLGLRDGLGAEFRADASRGIAAHVLALADRFGAGVVSLYWPIRSEVATLELMDALHAAGVSIALPVVDKPNLRFHAWQPGDPLRRATFGLSEPLHTAPRVRPTTMLVPLAAFDRRGHRIGYGGGYYDRAIAEYGRGGALRTIGLAFAVQEVDRIPAQAHDRRLDGIVTENGVLGSLADVIAAKPASAAIASAVAAANDPA